MQSESASYKSLCGCTTSACTIYPVFMQVSASASWLTQASLSSWVSSVALASAQSVLLRPRSAKGGSARSWTLSQPTSSWPSSPISCWCGCQHRQCRSQLPPLARLHRTRSPASSRAAQTTPSKRFPKVSVLHPKSPYVGIPVVAPVVATPALFKLDPEAVVAPKATLTSPEPENVAP